MSNLGHPCPGPSHWMWFDVIRTILLMTLNAFSEDLMQACVNSLINTVPRKLKFSIGSHQCSPILNITSLCNGKTLRNSKKFVYLGNTINNLVSIDGEVDLRISRASVDFGQLRTSLWDRCGFKLNTKLNVYQAVFLSSLLYACETWTIYECHARKLKRFHMNCLRKPLSISRRDRIPILKCSCGPNSAASTLC